jgi:hypoxanthine phosphoribosyltransferase
MTTESYKYAERSGVHLISWEDFHGLCKTLALAVEAFHPDLIVPIGRGGYYPGTLLAHILQVEIHPVRLSRRVHDIVRYAEPQWVAAPPASVAGQRVLVVDEICDSGETLRLVVEKCQAMGAAAVKSAVLYSHTHSANTPDYICIITDELLMNPWDREVLRNGRFQFHPEYEGALHVQGMEISPEMLIAASEFQLAKG